MQDHCSFHGIEKNQKDLKIGYMICFHLDYLYILESLYLIFQKEDIPHFNFSLEVQNTVPALSSLMEAAGVHMRSRSLATYLWKASIKMCR
jgi:hypothetical protein